MFFLELLGSHYFVKDKKSDYCVKLHRIQLSQNECFFFLTHTEIMNVIIKKLPDFKFSTDKYTVCNPGLKMSFLVRIFTFLRKTKSSIFWSIIKCNPLKVNQHFRGTRHPPCYRVEQWAKQVLLDDCLTLASCPAYSSTPNMELTCSNSQQTAPRYIPKYRTPHKHLCQNLKSYINVDAFWFQIMLICLRILLDPILSIWFDVLMTVAIKSCSLLKVNKHFRGTHCLHLQGQRIRQAGNRLETARQLVSSHWLTHRIEWTNRTAIQLVTSHWLSYRTEWTNRRQE
jgi:hypothetical protein